MNENITFVVLWICFKLIGIIALSLLIWWAAANKQFSDMEKCRWLPLKKNYQENKNDD